MNNKPSRTEAKPQPPTPIQQIEVQTNDGVSWKRGENGTRTLRVRSVRAKDRHFIDMSIEEISFPEDRAGRYISRQTFFSADGAHAQAVVDAVAPGYADLLAALKRFVAIPSPATKDLDDAARAAIARAEGR